MGGFWTGEVVKLIQVFVVTCPPNNPGGLKTGQSRSHRSNKKWITNGHDNPGMGVVHVSVADEYFVV